MNDPEEPPPIQFESGNQVPPEFLKPPSKGNPGSSFIAYPRIAGMPAQPGFRLDTIGRGWSLVLRRPGKWMINGIPMTLAFGLYVYTQFRLSEDFSGVTASNAAHAFVELLMLRYLIYFVLWTLLFLYLGTSTGMALEQIDGSQNAKPVLQNSRKRFWELLALAIAAGALLGLLQLIQMLLPLLLLPFLTLAPGLIVDKAIGVWDAILESFRITSPAYGGAMMVWILLLVQAILSFGLVGLGLALAAPVLVATITVSYRSFVPVNPSSNTS